MLQAVLTVQGRELVFLNTHIDFRPDDSERLANADEIHALVERYRGLPMIMCGDFNDTPESRTHARLARDFIDAWTIAGSGDGFTIPAAQPRKRIDYIWISRDQKIVPLKYSVPRSAASDQLPVVGEFRFAR